MFSVFYLFLLSMGPDSLTRVTPEVREKIANRFFFYYVRSREGLVVVELGKK